MSDAPDISSLMLGRAGRGVPAGMIAVQTAEEAERHLQEVLDSFFAANTPITVLEAGCGSASHVVFPPLSHVVGIDISPQQLERNSLAKEKIVGDIETYRFTPEQFDLVVCWNVVEHLHDPQAALRNLLSGLRPRGVLVVACPNRRSLKGLITRLTPHEAHVWLYRYVFGQSDAGRDGKGPFQTVLSRELDPEAVLQFAADNRLVVEQGLLYGGFGSGVQGWIGHTARLVYGAVISVIRLVTLARCRPELSEQLFVMRRMVQDR